HVRLRSCIYTKARTCVSINTHTKVNATTTPRTSVYIHKQQPIYTYSEDRYREQRSRACRASVSQNAPHLLVQHPPVQLRKCKNSSSLYTVASVLYVIICRPEDLWGQGKYLDQYTFTSKCSFISKKIVRMPKASHKILSIADTGVTIVLYNCRLLKRTSNLTFAAVAVLMLGDFCSASENLPVQDLGEVKRSFFPADYFNKRDNPWMRTPGLFQLGKRSWFPEEDKRALLYPYKRSDDNSWTHDFYKRSVEDQKNMEEVKRDNPWMRTPGLFQLGKRSFFPQDYFLHKRSVEDQQNLEEVKRDNPWMRTPGLFQLGKRSWFPEEDKRALLYPYKRSDDNSWTHDFYKRGAGTPYHIIRRSEPFNADVKDKRLRNFFGGNRRKLLQTFIMFTLFAAVAVLMLGDFCSASENLPGYNLEEVKHPGGHFWVSKLSLIPEDYKRSSWYPSFHKRSVDDQQNLEEVKRPAGIYMLGKRSWFPEEDKRSWFPEDYKRSSWYPLFHKRSVDDQQNLEEVKRPAGIYMLGKRSWFPEEDKRSWFPEDYKRASWYPLFHKRSDDNSWTHDFYKRNVGTPYQLIKRSGDNPWTRPTGIFMLGKRSWFPEEDKRALWYPYKRSDDNSWTHDFYKRSVGTPYHIIRRSEPFNADVKDKRAGINLNYSKSVKIISFGSRIEAACRIRIKVSASVQAPKFDARGPYVTRSVGTIIRRAYMLHTTRDARGRVAVVWGPRLYSNVELF
ncbi:unnamed protein product, partial [Trichogramma brassicae]